MRKQSSEQAKRASRRGRARLEKILLIVILCMALVLAGLILYAFFGHGFGGTRTSVAEEQTAELLLGQYAYEDLRDQGLVYQFALGPNGGLLLRETQKETNIFPLDTDGDGFADYGYYEVSTGDPSQPTVQVRVELYAENGVPYAQYAAYPVPAPTPAMTLTGWQTLNGTRYYLNANGSRSVGLQWIDGKLYYFNERGECAKALGVDVSFYDERIDWEAVKAQGIDFAIVRVGGRGWSSGLQYGDIRTRENLLGAKKAGVKLGVYFYSTAINEHEAVEDARAALATVGGLPLEFPIFIDMEFSGIYPEGRSDLLTGAQRANIVKAFCETVRAAGYRAGVYSSQNYFKYSMDYWEVAQYTIWLASYTRDNQLPSFSQRYDLWQFTDRGIVRGIAGNSDMNVIF